MGGFWVALAAIIAHVGTAIADEVHTTPRSCGGPAPTPDTCRPAPKPHEDPQVPGTPNVHCESTKGEFTIEMHPEWAPIGAARFYEAIQDGVYDDTCIYRVVRDQAVQFGFPKDKAIRERWHRKKSLKDDAQIFKSPNFHRGMIAYAGGGPNTRGIDLFITYMTGNANGTPRAPWETPFGIIDEAGMQHVTKFTPEYGDMVSFGGMGPNMAAGYEKLKETHPNIDYLGKCKLVYPAGWNAQGRIPGEPEAAALPVSHHEAAPTVHDQTPDEPVQYQADYAADGRPGFLNAGGVVAPRGRGGGDGAWQLNIQTTNGGSIAVPVAPILVVAGLAGCFRVALPKLSKMVWRKATRCDC